MKSNKKDNNIILNINLKNLIKNYKYLQKTFKNTEIAASVKANSYGLGTKETCSVLIENGCKSFFVATSDEAIFLRKNFNHVNIFLLNGVNDMNTCLKILKHNVTIVINNVQQLNVLKKVYFINKKRAKCAIHVDSGMNRLGFKIDNFQIIYKNIKKYLDVKLVISHLACSEKKNHYLNFKQLKLFENFKTKFFFSDDTLYSLANSNGLFLGQKYHFDIVRSGGFLFGLSLSKKNNPFNVVSLTAKIIQIQNISVANTIGYGATYTTKSNKVIATLAIGYADGLPRNYKGHALIKKKKAPFVGNISMDLSCIDITNIQNVKVGDWVEIFGENFSIFNFANICKTITYEISTHLGSRAKKIYNI